MKTKPRHLAAGVGLLRAALAAAEQITAKEDAIEEEEEEQQATGDEQRAEDCITGSNPQNGSRTQLYSTAGGVRPRGPVGGAGGVACYGQPPPPPTQWKWDSLKNVKRISAAAAIQQFSNSAIQQFSSSKSNLKRQNSKRLLLSPGLVI